MSSSQNQNTTPVVSSVDGSDVLLKMKIDPVRVLPYIFIHLGCLAVIFVGWSWFAVAAAAILYFVRMFSITAFYHRYFSHRAFKAGRFMQFLFAVLGNTSLQGGALWWAANHRHHHNHSDEPHDKHSPVQSGFWFSHIGWLFYAENFSTDYQKVRDYAKFPELVFLNRFDYLVPALYGAFLLVCGAFLERYFPQLGTNAWQLFIWGFFISTTVLLHGTLFINSLAHVWGRRRFDTEDDSRNNLFLALITLGEGWHNNHHRYQHSARQGFYWYEFDLSYYILRAMEKFRLIRDLKPVPSRIYEEAESANRNGQVT